MEKPGPPREAHGGLDIAGDALSGYNPWWSAMLTWILAISLRIVADTAGRSGIGQQ